MTDPDPAAATAAAVYAVSLKLPTFLASRPDVWFIDPVMKESVRICGDFKLTVNPVAKDSFPLPRTEDLFATLAGGKAFTKLDLAQTYLQVPLENSKRFVTINTPRGL